MEAAPVGEYMDPDGLWVAPPAAPVGEYPDGMQIGVRLDRKQMSRRGRTVEKGGGGGGVNVPGEVGE